MPVTHIYRREDGEWRIVHRHGDHPPVLAEVAAAASPATSNEKRWRDRSHVPDVAGFASRDKPFVAEQQARGR